MHDDGNMAEGQIEKFLGKLVMFGSLYDYSYPAPINKSQFTSLCVSN